MFTRDRRRGRRLGDQPGLQPDRLARLVAGRCRPCVLFGLSGAMREQRRSEPPRAGSRHGHRREARERRPPRGRAGPRDDDMADIEAILRSAGSRDADRGRVDRNRLLVAARRRRGRGRRPAAEPPVMVVDLDAFDANAADLVRRAGGKPIRVASKSLRVPALLARALDRDGLPRACSPTRWPRRCGWTSRASATTSSSPTRPSTGPRWPGWSASPAAAAAITLMVDDVAHLDVVDSVRSSQAVRPGRDRHRRRPADRRPARRPEALAALRRRRGPRAGPGDRGARRASGWSA